MRSLCVVVWPESLICSLFWWTDSMLCLRGHMAEREGTSLLDRNTIWIILQNSGQMVVVGLEVSPLPALLLPLLNWQLQKQRRAIRTDYDAWLNTNVSIQNENIKALICSDKSGWVNLSLRCWNKHHTDRIIEDTYHFLWSRFLHGGDALSFQVLVNLLLIHGIDWNAPPQFLKFCI